MSVLNMNVRMWVLSELFSVFIYLFIFYPLFDIQNNKPHWTFKKCSDAKQNDFKLQQKLKMHENPYLSKCIWMHSIAGQWLNLCPGRTDLYMHVWVSFESICHVFNLLSLSCFSSFRSLSLLPGIDFKVKTIDVDGKKVKLQVW